MRNGVVEFSEREGRDLRHVLHKFRVHLCSVQNARGKEDCSACAASEEGRTECIVGAVVDFLDKKYTT